MNSISEAIRPLSHDEMESVSGGFLMVPPISWRRYLYPVYPASAHNPGPLTHSKSGYPASITADQCSQSRHSSRAGSGILR